MDTLTLVDRGDCCSAQARVLVAKGDLRLAFCSHHMAKYKNRLFQQEWEVVLENYDGLSTEKAGVRA